MEDFPCQYIQIYLVLIINACYLIILLIWTVKLWECHTKEAHAPFTLLWISIIYNSQKGQICSHCLLEIWGMQKTTPDSSLAPPPSLLPWSLDILTFMSSFFVFSFFTTGSSCEMPRRWEERGWGSTLTRIPMPWRQEGFAKHRDNSRTWYCCYSGITPHKSFCPRSRHRCTQPSWEHTYRLFSLGGDPEGWGGWSVWVEGALKGGGEEREGRKETWASDSSHYPAPALPGADPAISQHVCLLTGLKS